MEDIMWPTPVNAIQGTLYSIHFWDARERLHVMLTDAPDPETALAKVIAYQEDRSGFRYTPDIDDVQVVEWNTQDETITLLYHADYD